MPAPFTNGDRLDLEKIIDRRGLQQTLNAIAEICGEKAEHIQSNWQDAPLASCWDRAGRALQLTAARAVFGKVSE